MKKKGFFLKLLWKAGKNDLLLSLPWFPIYSLAEVSLALSAGILLQLVFVTQEKIYLNALLPGKLKNYISAPISFDRHEIIFFIPILIVSIATLKVISTFLSSYLTERAGHKVAHKLRESLLEVFLNLPGNVIDHMNPGQISNELMQDTALLQGAISKGTISAIRDALVLLGILIFMLLISWKTFIVGSIVVVPLSIILKKVSQKLNFYTLEGQKKQITISSRLLLSKQGALTVHAMRTFDREYDDLKEISEENYKLMHKSLFVRTFFPPAMEFIAVFILAIAIQWRFSQPAHFEGGTYASLLILLAFSFRYIKNIAGTITFFSDIKVILERLRNHLNQGNETRAMTEIKYENTSKFAIQTTNICFQHLENTILNIPPLLISKGKRIALLGESGSGKTTFLRILSGLIKPTAGQVKLGSEFLMCPQTPYVFRGTIEENLLYTSEKSFQAQDKLENILIRLHLAYSPSGAQMFLNKKIGFLGDGLSGGEKARVALGRLLFASPPLILLDEPTANLDRKTAKSFWEEVCAWQKENKEERTVVAVTHTVEDIIDFDFCYVFKNGSIVHQGEPTLEFLADYKSKLSSSSS